MTRLQATLGPLLARRARPGEGFHRALYGVALDPLPRVHVDRYGPAWVATFHAAPDLESEAARSLAALLAESADLVVFRGRDGTRKGRSLARVVHGECPDILEVAHAGYRFEARLLDPIDPGAYPDSEPLRAELARATRDARVLNLFAFTCLNGVVARLAGARSVVNVDMARSHLERGRRNYRLNGLATDDRDFVAEDALRWCARAKPGAWDIVVVDPPPLIRLGRGHVPCEELLEEMLGRVLPLVAPGGTLHFLQCTARVSADELGARVRAACPGREVTVLAPLPPDLDPRELAPTFKDAVIR